MMRGRKGICLLCRHTFECRQSTNVTRRLVSTRSKEPYVLSRLVIDLDAADSKLVRKYEELEDDAIEPLDHPKVKNRLEAMKKREGTTRKVKPKEFLKTLYTTPPDLLFYALQGDPLASAMSKHNQLRRLFVSKMIQPEESAETKFQQLTNEFTTNDEERLRGSGFGEVDESEIVEQIRRCAVFSKLHRMISMLSRTHEGCQFLGRNGSAIMESIRYCRKEQSVNMSIERVSSEVVLAMLNNLQLNMEMKGVQFPARLTNAALHYAGRSYNLPAVRKYLKILREKSYETDWRTLSALKHVFRGAKSTPRGAYPSKHYKRYEVLQLITGWEKGRMTRDSEQRTLSFATVFTQDHSADFTTCLYPRYIMGLGELGLNDALWAEWTSEDKYRFPALIRGNDHERFRARMFALAFMVGKDHKRALEVLESVPNRHDDKFPANWLSLIQDWKPSGGGYVIVPNQSSGEWLLALIYEHYTFHGVKITDRLLNVVKTTIKALHKSPLKTLNAIERLLVQDVNINDLSKRELDWRRIKNREGLVIYPCGGKTDKPSKPRPEPIFLKPEKPISKLVDLKGGV